MTGWWPATGGSAAAAGGPPRSGPTEDLAARADAAAGYLKALAHEGRLMILCHLIDGEKSVTELEGLLELRQAAVSQQLARLRRERLVTARREGKVIHYALSDPGTARMIGVLKDLFCR